MGFLIFLPLVGTLAVIFVAVLAGYLFLRFILYIIQSIGLLRIAKREGYSCPYIVWIPAVSHYVLGRYCMSRKNSVIYCVLTAVNLAISILGFGVTEDAVGYAFLGYFVLYFIIDMLVMNQFYKKVYRNPKVFTILTVVTLGFLKPIFICTAGIISKAQPVGEKL